MLRCYSCFWGCPPNPPKTPPSVACLTSLELITLFIFVHVCIDSAGPIRIRDYQSEHAQPYVCATQHLIAFEIWNVNGHPESSRYVFLNIYIYIWMLSLSDLVRYVHWFQMSQIWMNATIHWKALESRAYFIVESMVSGTNHPFLCSPMQQWSWGIRVMWSKLFSLDVQMSTQPLPMVSVHWP